MWLNLQYIHRATRDRVRRLFGLHGPRRPIRRRPCSVRPCLEILEDRTVPTGLAFLFTGADAANPTEWFDWRNWSVGNPPGGNPTHILPNDDFVTIGAGTTCNNTHSGTTAERSLTVNGTFNFGDPDPNASSTLDITNGVSSTGPITLGAASGGGTATLDAASADIDSTLNIGYPSASGNPGAMDIGGSLIDSTAGAGTINIGSVGGSTGTLTVQTFSYSGVVNDNTNGVVNIGASALLSNSVIVAGKMNAEGSVPVKFTGRGNLTNTGTLSGQPGSSFTFATSAAWTIDSNGSPISNLGAGSYLVQGTLTINGMLFPAAKVTLAGGTFNGPGGLDFEQEDLTWTAGTFSDASGTTVENPISFDATGSGAKIVTSNFTDNGALTNLAGSGALAISGASTTFDLESCHNAAISLPVVGGLGGRTAPGTFTSGANDILEIQSPATAPLTIACNFNNLGLLKVDAADAAIISTVGGMFPVTDNLSGTVTLDGNLTLKGTVASASGLLQDAGSGTLYIGDGTTAGTLSVNGGNDLLSYGNIEVTGTGTLTVTGAMTTFSGSKLTLDVGSATSIGSFTQDGGGDLVVQASGPMPIANGTLTVTGECDLGGQFEMDFVGGYTPTVGTAFIVVRANPVKGTFYPVPQDVDMTYASGTVTATYTG